MIGWREVRNIIILDLVLTESKWMLKDQKSIQLKNNNKIILMNHK